jgi:autotransporter-associated beta strand protein
VTFQNALALQIKEGTLAMGIGNVPTGGGGMISMGDATTSGTILLNGAGATNTTRSFTLNAGGGAIRVEDSLSILSLNGTIVGTGGLTKTGNGTVVLNNGNDYSGGTIVSAGNLELNNGFGSGTGSGVVSVAGMLAGSGAIVTAPGNAVTITGVFQPGFMGATFGVDFGITVGSGASTTFGASSIARFDLWSTTGADQSAFFEAADRLVVGGDFTIAAGAILKLSNPNILNFQAGDVFRLFDWTAAGTVTGAWTIDSSDINLGELFLDTSALYTAGTISVTAVPEPGTAVFLMLGLGACIARRRRSTAVES